MLAAEAANGNPNIQLVVVDDMGRMDLVCVRPISR